MARPVNKVPKLREVAERYPKCQLCGEENAWTQGPAFDLTYAFKYSEGSGWSNEHPFGTLICRNCGNTVFIDIGKP